MIQKLKTFTLSFMLSAAIVGGSSAALGAVSYKYTTDVNALNLLPGQYGTVNLYLVETTTAPSTSRLVSENGLAMAYFGVSYVLPGTPLASPSTIFSISADTVVFNDISGPDEVVAGNHLSAYVQEYVDIAQPTGPTGVQVGPGVRQLFLGSVVLLGGTSGGITTFRVGGPPGIDGTSTIDGYLTPLDADGAIAPTTFTVSIPVPEPTSGILAGLIAGGLLTTRRRRGG